MSEISRPTSDSLLIGDLRHNHNKKIKALMERHLIPIINPGTATSFTVKHDDDCPTIQKRKKGQPLGFCNCDCEIFIGGTRYDDLLKREN